MVPDFDDLDLSLVRRICATALLQRGAGWLTTDETRTVLSAARVPLQAGGVAVTADAAVMLAHKLGWPVALKLASHQLVHKTEVGGVRLHLSDERSVRDAFE